MKKPRNSKSYGASHFLAEQADYTYQAFMRVPGLSN